MNDHMDASWPTWIDCGKEGIIMLTDNLCCEHRVSYVDAPRYHIIANACGIDIRNDDHPRPFHNGFPVPALMAKAIQNGECHEIMLADGNYEEAHVDENGHLHNDKGPALICTTKHSRRFWPNRVQDGQKMALWYEHGVGGKMEVLEGA